MNIGNIACAAPLWLLVGLIGAMDETEMTGTAVLKMVLGPFSIVRLMWVFWQESQYDRRRYQQALIVQDYEEVLRLIEWKPRELTPAEQLEEELSI